MSPTSSVAASSSATCGGSLHLIPPSSGDEQQVKTEPDRASEGPPPSGLVLQSGTTTISTARSPRTAYLSTLPTMLIFLVRTWLIDKDTLQLILSSHRLNYEVQGFYTLRLRPAVAKHCASPIASYQRLECRRPEYVPMGEEGEAMFQTCMALKRTALSEGDYSRRVVQAYKARLPVLTNPHQLSDLSIGAGLGLGGTLMTAAHWEVLLASFVNSDRPGKEQRRQILHAVYGLCLAHGGAKITPVSCAALMKTLLDIYESNHRFESNSKFPLDELMAGLFHGLGGSTMSRANIVTILELIMGQSETLGVQEKGDVTTALCRSMGGVEISAACRDTILAKILGSYATTSSEQMSLMLCGMLKALGGMTPLATSIRPENLDAVISQVLMSHGTKPELIYCVFIALGLERMIPAHRAILMTHIQKSDRRHDIVEAMKKSLLGSRFLEFLQLETA